MTIPNYEQMLEDFYTELLRSGDTCVDVGAHIGRHSLPIGRCVGPSGRVFAFEPLPVIFTQLEAAIASSDLAAIVLLCQCALSDVPGEADFVSVREAPEYSGLRTRHYDSIVTTETIRVKVLRLDDLFSGSARTVRYIKIDCEGSELKVLRGASELLRRDRPVISFECGDNSLESYEYDSGDIYDFFDAHGYDVQSITRMPLDRSGFVAAATRQEYWDYLAFPR